ncbi:MAG: DsbA family protein [Propionibacteriaceae bacterium]
MRAATVRRERRRRNTKLTVSLVAVGVLLTAGALIYRGVDQSPQATPAGPPSVVAHPEALVDEDTRVLSQAPGAEVALVEFLDFECEACRAVYPAIEQLRQQYDGEVTFAIKYFPIESHFNSMRAARAVEAAAQQGQLEGMYKLMYETQAEWGEQQVAMDDRFRDYAVQLGVDMDAWDAAYDDPATEARIQEDMDEGDELEVTGTPTFFLNGERLEPESLQDLTDAIDAALAEK